MVRKMKSWTINVADDWNGRELFESWACCAVKSEDPRPLYIDDRSATRIFPRAESVG